MNLGSPQAPSDEFERGFQVFFERICTPIERKILRLHFGIGCAGLDASSKRRWLAELLKDSGVPRMGNADRSVMEMTQAIRDRHPLEIGQERLRWFSAFPHVTRLEQIVDSCLDTSLPEANAHRKLVACLLDAPVSVQEPVATKISIRESKREARGSDALSGSNELVSRLLQRVDYPAEVSNAFELVELSRGGARMPGEGSNGNIRAFVSAKNDAHFLTESDQEWSVANWLEECHMVLRYSSQPVEIFYHDAQGKTRSHFPDFFVQLRDGRGFLLELKPFEHMFFRSSLRKTVAARNHAHRRGLGYCHCCLARDQKLFFLADIGNVQVPDPAKAEFLKIMDAGGFATSSAMVRFRQAHALRNRHLFLMILTENLDYENNREKGQFWLRRANDPLSLSGLV